jgi:hypothetical protein
MKVRMFESPFEDRCSNELAERVAAHPGSIVCHQNQSWPRLAMLAARPELFSENPDDEIAPPGGHRWSTARSRAEADRSSLLQLQPGLEAFRHRGEATVRLGQRCDTRGRQRIELLTAAVPLRLGITDPGF